MKSMTGYGYCETQNEKLHTVIELKSYNHRYLDIIIYLPNYLNQIEQKIRGFISSRVKRGRVELYLKVREQSEDIIVSIDKEAACSYTKAFKELIEVAGINDRVHLSHLLRMDGVIKTENKRDIEYYWSNIEPLLENVFKAFEESRVKEGLKINEDLIKIIEEIWDGIKKIEMVSPEIKEYVTSEIRKRFEELLGENIDEVRIYSETAMLLIKFDINEEIVRLKTHLERFSEIIKNEEGVSKSLDFIAQELNREINTIGSKSMNLKISSTVLEVKGSIERIREQLRNAE